MKTGCVTGCGGRSIDVPDVSHLLGSALLLYNWEYACCYSRINDRGSMALRCPTPARNHFRRIGKWTIIEGKAGELNIAFDIPLRHAQ